MVVNQFGEELENINSFISKGDTIFAQCDGCDNRIVLGIYSQKGRILSIMAELWDALIANNSNYVMPLS